ncbi:MAG TPA: argininosuccinate synthase [Planctomycetota bacterium]|nr:argininosuccinate synthase [Planctomycetota bacterium]
MRDLVVLAFSGGLDTSFLVPWLRETRGVDVATVTVDTGGLDDAARKALAARAAELGAVRHETIDARRAFFDETLRYLLAGNVLRGGFYPLCVGAERSLQARATAEAARRLGAKAVAHGCTAAGNDQVRFEVALRTLAPDLEILAPVRDHAFTREAEAAYLRERGVPADPTRAAYSVNRGLWGATIGGRETGDTKEPLPEHAWVLTRGAFDAPRAPRALRLSFRRGAPCALDGEEDSPVELIERLEAIAAEYGVGRGLHLGDTILGMKGRVAFEAPAAHVLLLAHRELEKLVLTARQQRLKEVVALSYGDWVHEGQFLDPACRDAEALLDRSQERVEGEVRVLLRQGSAFVEGVTSPFSLKAASKAVYGEAAGEWTPEDARGYSRLLALPSMLAARAAARRDAAAGAAS